ncbi:MAG: twin-arginine translocase TatA/TatE family subunit [bacterium]
MLGGIGWQEILVILLVVLVLFGAKRIPEIARGLGRGITDFRRAVKEGTDEIKKIGDPDDDDKPTPKAGDK